MAKYDGSPIRKAREDRNERVEDVAPLFDISPGTLRGIENGRTYASPATIRKICEYYSLDEADLEKLSDEDEPSRIDHTVPLNERLFYSAEEAALVLAVPYMTIIRAIGKGNGPLKAAKVGREWRIHRPELERWFAELVEQTRQSA